MVKERNRLCKNCRFFKKNPTEEIGQGECYNSKLLYSSHVKSQDELAYMDYEGYYAELIVGENFGCIHFQER